MEEIGPGNHGVAALTTGETEEPKEPLASRDFELSLSGHSLSRLLDAAVEELHTKMVDDPSFAAWVALDRSGETALYHLAPLFFGRLENELGNQFKGDIIEGAWSNRSMVVKDTLMERLVNQFSQRYNRAERSSLKVVVKGTITVE